MLIYYGGIGVLFLKLWVFATMDFVVGEFGAIGISRVRARIIRVVK